MKATAATHERAIALEKLGHALVRLGIASEGLGNTLVKVGLATIGSGIRIFKLWFAPVKLSRASVSMRSLLIEPTDPREHLGRAPSRIGNAFVGVSGAPHVLGLAIVKLSGPSHSVGLPVVKLGDAFFEPGHAPERGSTAISTPSSPILTVGVRIERPLVAMESLGLAMDASSVAMKASSVAMKEFGIA